MFDPDDPVLARVRDLALALPGADEKVSHGRPAFFTKRMFGYYGGSHKVDGEWVQHAQAVMVRVERMEREALLARDDCWVPAYLGPSGWIGVDLHDDTDWDEVAELLDQSFRLTAPSRLVAQLPALPDHD